MASLCEIRKGGAIRRPGPGRLDPVRRHGRQRAGPMTGRASTLPELRDIPIVSDEDAGKVRGEGSGLEFARCQSDDVDLVIGAADGIRVVVALDEENVPCGLLLPAIGYRGDQLGTLRDVLVALAAVIEGAPPSPADILRRALEKAGADGSGVVLCALAPDAVPELLARFAEERPFHSSPPAGRPRHWLLEAARDVGIREALERFGLRCRTCGTPLIEGVIQEERGPGGELVSAAVDCGGPQAQGCGTQTNVPWPGPSGVHPLHPADRPVVEHHPAEDGDSRPSPSSSRQPIDDLPHEEL